MEKFTLEKTEGVHSLTEFTVYPDGEVLVERTFKHLPTGQTTDKKFYPVEYARDMWNELVGNGMWKRIA